MSTFQSCINDGVREGLIREEDANEINTMFDQLSGEYRGNMANAPADARAAADTLATIRRQKTETRRRKLLQARNWRNIETILDTHRTPFGRQDPADAAKSLLGHVRDQKFSSVESRAEAIRGIAFKKNGRDTCLIQKKHFRINAAKSKAKKHGTRIVWRKHW